MRSIFFFLLFITIFESSAQLIPAYTNYSHFPGIYNPAAINFEQDMSATVLARKKWIGIDGSPFYTEFVGDYRLENTPIGIGVVAAYHTAGYQSDFDVRFQTAARFEMVNEGFLQIGAEINALNYRIQNAYVSPSANSPSSYATDNAIGFGAGFFVCQPAFFAGFSSRYINKPYLNEINLQTNRFLSGTIGFNINPNERTKITPSALYVSTAPNINSFTFSLNFQFDGKLNAGGGYRTNDAAFIQAGFLFSDFNVGYSFDLNTNNSTQQYARGSHEFFFKWYLKR